MKKNIINRKIKRRKLNFKLIIFLILLCCIYLGYALFTQELVMNGTITGSVNFKVYFMEAWIKHSDIDIDRTDLPNGKDKAEISSGAVNINALEGADKLTFQATLNYPGDKILIGTKIKNESSIRVKLNDFKIKKNANNPDIKLNYISLYGNTENLNSNEICEYQFVVEWDENANTTNQNPVEFEITLDYEQYTENPMLEANHTHEAEEVPDLQEYKIELLGNDEIQDNYTIYVGEEREIKAVVKSVYSDGTEKVEADKTINWTVTNENGSIEYQIKGNIITFTGNQVGNVSLKAECVEDGIYETKQINVLNWSVIDKAHGIISDGINTLTIGQYVDYDNTKNANGENITTSYISTKEKNGTSNVTFNAYKYADGWRILGVSNGRLQLISANTVGTVPLRGASGYLNGEDELNSICSIYGNGKNADSVKCLNVNDVNEITGYNPKLTGTGRVRAKGELWEYGNVVTFKWKTDKNLVAYGRNGKQSNVSSLPFTYYDENEKIFTTLPVNKEFYITSNSYNYYPSTLIEDSNNGTVKGIATSNPLYQLLFTQKYWLASRYHGASSILEYGFFAINNSKVYEADLVSSVTSSSTKSFSAGVRPVVTLSAYTRIKANYESGNGTTKAKAWGIE